MCGCGEKKTTSSMTQKVPKWMESAGQSLFERAESSVSGGYQPYTGPVPVGQITGDETAGFDMTRGIAGSSNEYLPEIEALLRNFSGAPAQSVSAPRLIDNIPGGPGATGGEGSIQDYMNPYIRQVLDPVLRQISEKGQKDRLGINAQATAAGAFGDSRHGVERGMSLENENQLGTDTTGKAMADAFATAMGLRSDDINRLLGVQTTNANFAETALGRGRAGATDMMNLDKYETGRGLDLAAALQRIGATQRDVTERSDKFAYDEFQRGQSQPLETSKTLAAILAALPYTKHSTGTTTAEDNGIWKEIAGIGGSIFGAI